MQQHLLSPALPPPPADILPAPSSQAVVSSVFPDSAMTTTITTTVKRKRTDLPDTMATAKPVLKKKKANRACIHCQKAHLTCDDCSCSAFQPSAQVFRVCSRHGWFFFSRYTARPCQRCIKRGMPTDCVEGHRKKAKYLLDDEELGQYSLPHISRTGDLILAPTPHRSPPTKRDWKARKRRKQRSQEETDPSTGDATA